MIVDSENINVSNISNIPETSSNNFFNSSSKNTNFFKEVLIGKLRTSGKNNGAAVFKGINGGLYYYCKESGTRRYLSPLEAKRIEYVDK